MARNCSHRPVGRAVVVSAVLVITAIGCGNRLSRDELLDAARGPEVTQSDAGAEGERLAEQPPLGGGFAADGAPNDPVGDGGGVMGSEGEAGGRSPSGAARTPASLRPGTEQDAAAAPAGAPITIGSVGNYSGAAGNSQAPGAKALQAWAQWVNSRGGLDGHPVKLIVVDDGADPARHQAALQDLVENHGVVAFVANLASITHHAGRRYLEEKRVPVIGGEVSVEVWYQSPMFFPQGARYRSLILGMAKAGARIGKQRLGVLTCQEAEVCTNVDRWLVDEGLAREGGLDPVYRAKMSLTQPDFTAECLAARNAGVEILSVTGDPNTVGRVYSSCARQNFRPVLLQHSATVDNRTQLLDDGKIDVVLVTLTFPWVVSNTPATKEYRDAMERYNVETSAATSLGWASGKLFERVVTSIGDPISRERVLEGLWGLEGETLGGLTPPLAFRRDQPAHDSGCWFTLRASGGRWQAPNGGDVSCP